MLKIGLTGNIGSGKTVVAEIFRTLEIPVFYADTEARKLLDVDKTKIQLLKIFGQGIFSPNGSVKRSVLAEIVFNDKDLLYELNKVIHPLVRTNFKLWCEKHSEETYTLYEAAILFESGHYKEMDKVICVVAPEHLRISRVIDRDGVSKEEVLQRMASQWEEERKVELSDYVIVNDGNSSVIEQVMNVHSQLTVDSRQLDS